MTPNSAKSANAQTGEAAASPALEAAIARALSHTPTVSIPPDFAARVARAAQRQAVPQPRPWLGWGPRLTLGSGLLLTLSLFALAPHALPTLRNPAFDLEMLLLAELGTLLLFSQRLLFRG